MGCFWWVLSPWLLQSLTQPIREQPCFPLAPAVGHANLAQLPCSHLVAPECLSLLCLVFLPQSLRNPWRPFLHHLRAMGNVAGQSRADRAHILSRFYRRVNKLGEIKVFTKELELQIELGSLDFQSRAISTAPWSLYVVFMNSLWVMWPKTNGLNVLCLSFLRGKWGYYLCHWDVQIQ